MIITQSESQRYTTGHLEVKEKELKPPIVENEQYKALNFIIIMNNQTQTTNRLHFEDLDWRHFEQLSYEILYREKKWKKLDPIGLKGNDNGVDILGIDKEETTWYIQCKNYNSPQGNTCVQEVYSGKNYYNSDFTSELEVRTALNQKESKKSIVLNKLSSDLYKNIKIIHDYLINNIEYDQTYKAKGTYTIYGGLIGKTCVCDGYARSFKYLANAAGIECELIQGTATNSNGTTESHAWDAVKINNRWYYIDVTWDDPVIVGKGNVPNSYYYRYFLKSSGTFEKDHVTNGQFSKDGKVFNYPTVSISDY